jgi:hypothetical protein
MICNDQSRAVFRHHDILCFSISVNISKCNIASILLATDLPMYPFKSESYLFRCILHTSCPYNWCSSFCLMSLNDYDFFSRTRLIQTCCYCGACVVHVFICVSRNAEGMLPMFRERATRKTHNKMENKMPNIQSHPPPSIN